jgi:chemotaxis protein histidine kinase CheA
MADRPDVQVIKPPNTLLKAKTGSGKVAPDMEAIERAEAAIQNIGDDFANWAQSDLDELDKALAAARRNPSQQEEYITEIFRRAMELKGQGGSFGYELISQVGESLKVFTENRSEANPRDVEIIAAHVDAMRRVMVDDIKGDGGDIGRAIVAGLHKLTGASKAGG